MTRMVLDHGGGVNSNVSAVNKRNAESGRSSGKVDEDRRSALEF